MKRRFAAICGAAMIVALVCLCVTMPPLWQAGYPEWDGAPYFENTPDLIDINTAPVGELTCLPKIGEKRAQAIIDYRTQNGPFASVEELANIKGISMRTVEELRCLVYIS